MTVERVDYSKKRKLFLPFSVSLFLFIFFLGIFSGQLNLINSKIVENIGKPQVIKFSIGIINGKTMDIPNSNEMLISINIVSIGSENLRDVVFEYGIDDKFLRQETLAIGNNNNFLEDISVPTSTSFGDHFVVVEVYDLEGKLLGTSTESFTILGEKGFFRKIIEFLF